MSMSLVQSTLGGSGAGTGTTPLTVATSAAGFSSPTIAGDLLVLVGWIKENTVGPNAGGAAFLGLPATAGLTWVRASAHSIVSGTGYVNGAGTQSGSVAIWYVANAPSIATSATTVLTAKDSGSGVTATIDVEFALFEFSGVALSSPVDVVKNSPGTFGASGTVSAGTPLSTTATDLVLVAFTGNGSNLSAGSGYALGPNATVATIGQNQYELNVAAGSVSTAFGGSQTNYGATAATFKAPSASGGFSFGSLIGF